ncbi:DNA cytosine methyltransferase [Alteromonas sp. KUL106]|uniref:DNA cytosine methyltransferase n=1 Tax=Alteromonas sp. KUL106 TaxID=2480799 RepID=UPI0012E5E5A9|nr:DNA (cytosine-5-)-methyltransferase [Alteromonas sp. KUL106]GFD67924.1 DNA (cytosine-5-)-methyltransferase [Alteromonas sp. KUL106]
MKFAEFFAGVGLVREGLAIDGWECVWANDICENKMQTYLQNYGEDHFRLGNVWDYVDDPTSIPDDIFLYTASFPCTDLSVAGGRAGLAGVHSGSLNAVLKILLNKRRAGAAPKVILLENVLGFITSHGGKDLSDTVNLLNELGYVVDVIEINAAHFTPQSRQRVFLVAVDKEIASNTMKVKSNDGAYADDWWEELTSRPDIRSLKLQNVIRQNKNLNWGLVKVPPLPVLSNSLIDIIDESVGENSKYWWDLDRKNKLFSQMNNNHKRILEYMSAQDSLSYGTVYRRMRKGLSMAELRTDGIAGCLRTPRGGSSKQILIQGGFGDWKVRLLTPREYARLQGVRDSYILPVKDNQGYFAMGDAVCVPVINFISQHILTPIYSAYIDKKIKKAS